MTRVWRLKLRSECCRTNTISRQKCREKLAKINLFWTRGGAVVLLVNQYELVMWHWTKKFHWWDQISPRLETIPQLWLSIRSFLFADFGKMKIKLFKNHHKIKSYFRNSHFSFLWLLIRIFIFHEYL